MSRRLLSGKGLFHHAAGVAIGNPAGSLLLVADGDSITQNQVSGINVNSYPNLYAATNPGKITLCNTGGAGAKLAGIISNRASNIALIGSNPGFANYIYTLMIGYNDNSTSAYYPSGAATYVADIATHLDAVKAGGFNKVIIISLPDSVLDETWIATVNSGLAGLVPAHANAFVNLWPSPIGANGAHTNTAYFLDGVHLTQLGQNIFETFYQPVVDGQTIAALPPGQPTGLTATPSSTYVTLNWTAPSTGGYYTDFVVQYALAGTGSWTSFAHAASRTPSLLVSGLTPSTNYDFRVAATGEGGTSAFSSIVTQSTIASIPAGPNCVLLLHCDGAQGSSTISDSSGKGHAVAMHIVAGSGPIIDTATKKYGTGAYLSDFANDAGYMTLDGSADFSFGTGDFTIDFWVYPSDIGIDGLYSTCATHGAFTANTIEFIIYSGAPTWWGGSSFNLTGGAIATNVWQHIAAVRASGVLTLYVNGTSVASAADTNNYLNVAGAPVIGAAALSGDYYFSGHFDEIRVLNGRAAWAANFTPPTAPYT
jgi:lysophospholipase L1-like esterase